MKKRKRKLADFLMFLCLMRELDMKITRHLLSAIGSLIRLHAFEFEKSAFDLTGMGVVKQFVACMHLNLEQPFYMKIGAHSFVLYS